jgi:hypothetical protein
MSNDTLGSVSVIRAEAVSRGKQKKAWGKKNDLNDCHWPTTSNTLRVPNSPLVTTRLQ